MSEVKKVYGDFTYTELAKGAVSVDHSWVMDNIVTLKNVANTGLNIQLHRLVAPIFEACLPIAMATCQEYKIRMLGGFVPRHKMWDIKRGLSIHSWGAAFDVNWDTNGCGQNVPHDLPPSFIKVFTDQGWDFGGDWSSPSDWMHLQYATGC